MGVGVEGQASYFHDWHLVTIRLPGGDDLMSILEDVVSVEVTLSQRSATRLSAHLWCLTNMITGRFHATGETFYFEDARDAMTFKLVWT